MFKIFEYVCRNFYDTLFGNFLLIDSATIFLDYIQLTTTLHIT